MAFRKKAEIILQSKPDILVIIECEHPEKLIFNSELPKPTDILWFGNNHHKGIALFSYCEFRFKKFENHNENFKSIIPIEITSEKFKFNLFLIWAFNPDDREGKYITQVWKAINYYDSLLINFPTVLIGDFNSNTIWDKKHKMGNHSSVVQQLEKRRIYSTYHYYYNQIQGTEEHPTFYMHRHRDKPYHIDYCFVSSDILERLQSVHVGDSDFWLKYSDHVPLIMHFTDFERR